MDWFSDWFDSKYYHILYTDRDNAEAEHFISNILDFLKPGKDQHILDLACGKGRHSKLLNDLGYRVTGVDLSENSIMQAKQFSNDRLIFDTHDMRDVYAENEFDFVLNLFTSFGYFNSSQENRRVVCAIEKQLKNNGILVLDYMNAEKVISNLIEEEKKTINGIDFRIQREIVGNNVVKTIEFQAEGKQQNFQEKVELLGKTDFINLLNATSLRLIHTFGSYDLQEFDPSTSDRIILLAKKEQ